MNDFIKVIFTLLFLILITFIIGRTIMDFIYYKKITLTRKLMVNYWRTAHIYRFYTIRYLWNQLSLH